MISHRLVLHIDDDDDDRHLLNQVISEQSPEIKLISVDSGTSAISVLTELERENRLPELIILDINMPGLTGRDILEIIKAKSNWTGIPVAVFSTSCYMNDYDFFQNHQVKVFVKPFDSKKLQPLVSEMLSLCVHKNVRF